MSVTTVAVADKEFLFHKDRASFDFLNDSGSDIPAGSGLVLIDGTVGTAYLATIHRTIANGRVGAAWLGMEGRVYQAPYAGGSNVAVGEILSLNTTTGNLVKGTTGSGRFVAMPKQGGTLTGASAAASTTDDSILVVQVTTNAAGGGGGSTITDTVSNGVTIRHDGSGTPTATLSGNTATITPNGTKILSVEFTATASSNSIVLTHNVNGKFPIGAVYTGGNLFAASSGAKTATQVTVGALTNGTVYDAHFDF